jgi:tetratricopeptide (TPR) repeat protein
MLAPSIPCSFESTTVPLGYSPIRCQNGRRLKGEGLCTSFLVAGLLVLVAGLLLLFFVMPAQAAEDILWKTLYDAGEKARLGQNFAEAEKQLRLALRQAQNIGSGNSRIMATLKSLSDVLEAEGKNDEAESLLKRLLEADRAEHGPKSAEVAGDTSRLALLYRHADRYQESEESFLKSLAIMKEAGKKVSPAQRVALLSSFAVLYMDMGNYFQSENLLRQALSISESATGESSVATADCLSKLSRLYAVQNRFSEAEPLLERSLQMEESLLGPGNLALSRDLVELGKLYGEHGEMKEAESLLKRALTLQEKVLGPDHPDNAASLLELSRFYMKTDRAPAALALCDRALAIREKVCGTKSLLYADALKTQALALLSTNMYERAEAAFSQAIEIDRIACGQKSREVVQDLSNLGLLYLSQGKYRRAEPFYLQAVAVMESICGSSHPDLSTCLNNLAWLYQNEGRYVEALSAAQRGLEIREKSFGPAHPFVARCLSNLAQIYEGQGNWREATSLLKRAGDIESASLSAGHPEIAAIIRDLALACVHLADWSAAEDCYRKLLVLDSKQEVGPACIAADLDDLAGVLIVQNKLDEAKPLLERSRSIKKNLPGAGSSQTLARESDEAFGQGTAGRNGAASTAISAPIKDKWAVVIGISNFKDPRINLKYAAKDAVDFCNYLTSDAGFQRDHVRLLTDRNASRENIVAGLGDGWLKRLVRPEDLVVIYISTHGSEARKQADNANFLVPYDANLDNLVFNGIPMQWLTAGLEDLIRCNRIVLILDACHGGAADPESKGLMRSRGLDPYAEAVGRGEIIIASSQADQVSWESRNYPNSTFTHGLLEGLAKKGKMTSLQEAFKYMKEKVEEEVLRDRAEIQTPVLITGKWQGGDLLLAAPPVEPRPGLAATVSLQQHEQ